MIHLITFIVKLTLTLFILMSCNVFGLASLITWDIKYLEIYNYALKNIWIDTLAESGTKTVYKDEPKRRI